MLSHIQMQGLYSPDCSEENHHHIVERWSNSRSDNKTMELTSNHARNWILNPAEWQHANSPAEHQIRLQYVVIHHFHPHDGQKVKKKHQNLPDLASYHSY
jgi:hypothetical protein